MMTYESAKTWYKENQDKMVLGVCFILVFLVGFGTGSYKKLNSSQSNYIITSKAAPPGKVLNATTGGESPAPVAVKPTTTPVQSGSCIIKGNVSTKGKKVYHVQGGAFYKTVKPEQCFNTEEEARAAGFVKSGR